MRRSKHLRRAATGLALALAVVVAAPAAAAPPSWSGGWIDFIAGYVGDWWAATSAGESAALPSVRAGSEASPNIDLNGDQQPDGSGGADSFTATDPTDEGEASPRLDPDG